MTRKRKTQIWNRRYPQDTHDTSGKPVEIWTYFNRAVREITARKDTDVIQFILLSCKYQRND